MTPKTVTLRTRMLLPGAGTRSESEQTTAKPIVKRRWSRIISKLGQSWRSRRTPYSRWRRSSTRSRSSKTTPRLSSAGRSRSKSYQATTTTSSHSWTRNSTYKKSNCSHRPTELMASPRRDHRSTIKTTIKTKSISLGRITRWTKMDPRPEKAKVRDSKKRRNCSMMLSMCLGASIEKENKTWARNTSVRCLTSAPWASWTKTKARTITCNRPAPATTTARSRKKSESRMEPLQDNHRRWLSSQLTQKSTCSTIHLTPSSKD